MKKIKKKKRPTRFAGLKKGDQVAYTTKKRIIFGDIVAIAKDWSHFTLNLEGFSAYWDLPANQILTQKEYGPRHHKQLLGVKTDAIQKESD